MSRKGSKDFLGGLPWFLLGSMLGGSGRGGGGFGGGGGRFFSVPAEPIAPKAQPVPGQADKIGPAASKQIPQFDNRSIELLKKKRTL